MALTTTDLATVLVAEDAPEFCQLLDAVLSSEGYAVHVAPSGTAAIELAREIHPDVIVLDLGLPDIAGLEVCRQIRQFSNAYVIMLAARCHDVDRLLGLTIGADEYLTRPFPPRELANRIHDVMRHPRRAAVAPSMAEPGHIRAGEIDVDMTARTVYVAGVAVELADDELQLLGTLMMRPSMVFSRQMLLERVWADAEHDSHHLVDVHVANLRRKIDANGSSHIKTVRGVGYRMA